MPPQIDPDDEAYDAFADLPDEEVATPTALMGTSSSAPLSLQEQKDAAQRRFDAAVAANNDVLDPKWRADYLAKAAPGFDPSRASGPGEFLAWQAGAKAQTFLTQEATRRVNAVNSAQLALNTASNRVLNQKVVGSTSGVTNARAAAAATTAAIKADLAQQRIDLQTAKELATEAQRKLNDETKQSVADIKAAQAEHIKDTTNATTIATTAQDAVDKMLAYLAPVGTHDRLNAAMGLPAGSGGTPQTTTLDEIRANATQGLIGSQQAALAAMDANKPAPPVSALRPLTTGVTPPVENAPTPPTEQPTPEQIQAARTDPSKSVPLALVAAGIDRSHEEQPAISNTGAALNQPGADQLEQQQIEQGFPPGYQVQQGRGFEDIKAGIATPPGSEWASPPPRGTGYYLDENGNPVPADATYPEQAA